MINIYSISYPFLHTGNPLCSRFKIPQNRWLRLSLTSAFFSPSQLCPSSSSHTFIFSSSPVSYEPTLYPRPPPPFLSILFLPSTGRFYMSSCICLSILFTFHSSFFLTASANLSAFLDSISLSLLLTSHCLLFCTDPILPPSVHL